jgi:hypothetical protein
LIEGMRATSKAAAIALRISRTRSGRNAKP